MPGGSAMKTQTHFPPLGGLQAPDGDTHNLVIAPAIISLITRQNNAVKAKFRALLGRGRQVQGFSPVL